MRLLLTERNSTMEYFKINITLFKCVEAEDASSHTPQNAQPNIQPSGSEHSAKETLLKDLVGDGIFSSLQDFFRVPHNIDDEELGEQEHYFDVKQNEPCDSPIGTFGLDIHPWHLTLWFLGCITVLVVPMLFWKISKKVVQNSNWTRLSAKVTFWKKSATKNSSPDAKVDLPEPKNESKADISKTDPIITSQLITKGGGKEDKVNPIYGQVKLNSITANNKIRSFHQSAVTKFLEETTNKLFSKLDRLLLKGGPSTMNQTQPSIATPRLARRTLGRRHRVGSTPSLPLQGPSNSDTDSGNQQSTESWENLKMFGTQFGWRVPCKVCPDVPGITRESQKLLQYFDRECPCNSDHWKATMLIINYILYLIKSELESMVKDVSTGYRFVQFIPTGSLAQGTTVARLHSLDVLMLVQPKVIPEAVICESENENQQQILPGKVILTSDKNTGGHSVSTSVNGNKMNCLSSKGFQKAAEDLVKDCLQNLYSKTRSLMDRLPFQIRQAPTAVLQLNIDTRALVGLNENEIKINLVPVLPVVTEGVLQSPVLYATPPIESFDEKQRNASLAVGNPETYWDIRYDAFEEEFINRVNDNMKYGGIDSCHRICLMILKSLLTGCTKNSLLDRGVLHDQHISTVLHFLVLESTPEQWTYDHLGDRFSDVIHFICEAFTTGRLPGFFMNNPHLVDKMPSVSGNKILTRKKQQNLLMDWPRERLDKCLDYMKDRLREAGLADCVKDEFSSDMWEYEFFVYN